MSAKLSSSSIPNLLWYQGTPQLVRFHLARIVCVLALHSANEQCCGKAAARNTEALTLACALFVSSCSRHPLCCLKKELSTEKDGYHTLIELLSATSCNCWSCVDSEIGRCLAEIENRSDSAARPTNSAADGRKSVSHQRIAGIVAAIFSGANDRIPRCRAAALVHQRQGVASRSILSDSPRFFGQCSSFAGFPSGAAEEGGADTPPPPGADPQLIPRQRRDLGGRRGGLEQQSEIGNEKILRLPDRESGKTRLIPQPRPTPRT